MSRVLVAGNKAITALCGVFGIIYNAFRDTVLGDALDKVTFYGLEDSEAVRIVDNTNFFRLLFLFLIEPFYDTSKLINHDHEMVTDGVFEVHQRGKAVLTRSLEDIHTVLEQSKSPGCESKRLLFASVNRKYNITNFMNTFAWSFNDKNAFSVYELYLLVCMKLNVNAEDDNAELVMIEDVTLKENVLIDADHVDMRVVNVNDDSASVNGVVFGSEIIELQDDDVIVGEALPQDDQMFVENAVESQDDHVLVEDAAEPQDDHVLVEDGVEPQDDHMLVEEAIQSNHADLLDSQKHIKEVLGKYV